jgi:4-amino-4-deoxy-L-arabinose transferase-like glycosyltransferase
VNRIGFCLLCFDDLFDDIEDMCALPYFSPYLYPLPNFQHNIAIILTGGTVLLEYLMKVLEFLLVASLTVIVLAVFVEVRLRKRLIHLLPAICLLILGMHLLAFYLSPRFGIYTISASPGCFGERRISDCCA